MGTWDKGFVDEMCEVMHNAYEAAAERTGWETQPASRKPWQDVPEANKDTMRYAMRELLNELFSRDTLEAWQFLKEEESK